MREAAYQTVDLQEGSLGDRADHVEVHGEMEDQVAEAQAEEGPVGDKGDAPSQNDGNWHGVVVAAEGASEDRASDDHQIRPCTLSSH